MKNVLIFTLLVVITSCNKKQCWTCKYSVTKTENGNTHTDNYTQEYCGKTRSEIKQIESANGYTDDINGIKYEYSKYSCNQGNPFK